MKRIFTVLGVVFVLIVVVAGAFIGYAAYSGTRLDHSSKAFVDTSLPAIAAVWSPDELLRRASPELKQVADAHPQQLRQLFKKFSALGRLEHYDGSKGESNMLYDATRGKRITAAYTANAVFEHPRAQFAVRLIRHAGQWQYLNFKVSSPLFPQ